MNFTSLLFSLGTTASIASALAIKYTVSEYQPLHALHPRDLVRRQNSTGSQLSTDSLWGHPRCINGPSSRNSWSPGFDINTDPDQTWPNTGRTVYHTLRVQNTTCNYDYNGPKECYLFNGNFPGDLIEANWGDMVEITVVNELQNQGTGIHWHGVRQFDTNLADGVPGVTECPIAPGQSTVYRFQATRYGVFWYHSHYASQLGDGLVGTLLVHGPSSANYDIDLGPVVLSDYYSYAAEEGFEMFNNFYNTQTGYPVPSTVLVNGDMKSSDNKTGNYHSFSFTKGKNHLLSIINTSVDTVIDFSVDGHELQVIAIDSTPVQPKTMSSVAILHGQRMQIVVLADQKPGNYWLRAKTKTECFCFIGNSQGGGLGIITYGGVQPAIPTSLPVTLDTTCLGAQGLQAYRPNNAGTAQAFLKQFSQDDLNITLTFPVTPDGRSWGLDGSSEKVDWQTPLISSVLHTGPNIPATENIFQFPTNQAWGYLILQEGSMSDGYHPMHIHGHDFYILGQQLNSTFDPKVHLANLQFNNVLHRDTIIAPSAGWIAVGIPMNNPGVWAVHCHIQWHLDSGLSFMGIENVQQMANKPGAAFQQQCQNWSSVWKTSGQSEYGSGM